MNSEGFIVNSKQALELAKKWLEDNFNEKKFSTYSVRHGEKRSLTQNALFHAWCTEYAAFALGKHPKQVEEGEREGVKRYFKKQCYTATGWDFLVIELVNIENKAIKRDFRSSSSYKCPEMFQFLTWVQAYALDRGCLLESKGEFQGKQDQNA